MWLQIEWFSGNRISFHYLMDGQTISKIFNFSSPTPYGYADRNELGELFMDDPSVGKSSDTYK